MRNEPGISFLAPGQSEMIRPVDGEERRDRHWRCDVGIVVLTYNSEATIAACIKTILEQRSGDRRFEVVAIDNGSTDGTIAILKQWGVAVFVHPSLNIPQLRNKALDYISAPLIGYVDSDCLLDSSWLSKAVHWFMNPKVAAVGNRYSLPDNASTFEKNWLAAGRSEASYGDLIPAGNLVVRRDWIQDIGGFNESLMTGEDADLLHRLRAKGYLAVSDPDMRNVHLGNPKTMGAYYRKEVWYGIGTDWRNALRNGDKPFITSVVFLGCLLGLAAGVLAGSHLFSGLMLGGALGVPILAAADRKFRKNIGGNIFYMTCVYIVYFLARIHSMVYIFGLRSYSRDRIYPKRA